MRSPGMGKKKQIRTLRERLAWPTTLFTAFVEVTRNANPRSAGPDGVSVETFKRSFRSELKLLRNELLTNRYCPSPGYGVALFKNPTAGIAAGNVRPITVFNVRDRVIQRAIANVMWIYLRDHVYSEVSFGGIRSYKIRRGNNKICTSIPKNVQAAARKILELRNEGYVYTFETDIRNFFPSIDKERLLVELLQVLPDATLRDLLQAAIATFVTNADEIENRGLAEYWNPGRGVPQGGVLSPLLANFYLSSFDAAMISEGFKMVRYVDDLVILCRSEADARQAFSFCKSTLASVGLSIHDIGAPDTRGRCKTNIVPPDRSFDFLGLRLSKYSVRPSDDKLDALRSRIRHITDTRLCDGETLVSTIDSLNRLVDGWLNAYRFCDLSKDVLREIDHELTDCLGSWLKYFKLIRSPNLLDDKVRKRLGLTIAKYFKTYPLSKMIVTTEKSGSMRVAEAQLAKQKSRAESSFVSKKKT